MNWNDTKAAVFRRRLNGLKAVIEFDEIALDRLVGLDFQKEILLKNTADFLGGKGANHALLWGERGCGKSSLCKAIFTKFMSENLRVIEIGKDDLEFLVDILDEIRTEPFKFIIFCDDLSFESGDDSYKFLKPLLEGSIERTPENVLFYATTNRRHLISEHASDNQSAQVGADELHLGDAVQEKLALSDRFGIWLSFYQGNFDDYLAIVDSYFRDFKGDKTALFEEAKRYAMLKSSRSGRTAKQFYLAYKGKFDELN